MTSTLLIDTCGPMHTLAENEEIIGRHIGGVIEFAKAVMEIRVHRQYRDAGYTRFEDYCQEKWGWTRQYVNKQIEAVEVMAVLTNGNNCFQTPATVSQARELAPLLRQDEAAVVEVWQELREEYGDRVTAKIIKQTVDRRLRLDIARERVPEPAVTPAMPTGKYRCIVLDPPWPMQKIEREERPNQGRALDYPVMSLDEIAALPVAELAEPDGCHIYLWVTQKYLPDGLQLFDAWGVRYQCVMTWVKNVGFTPFSWQYSTEHVLFGRIGSLDLLRLGMRLDFNAPVNGHSRKPDAFYNLVREASPGPRLELFARQPREGFTVWGNQV